MNQNIWKKNLFKSNLEQQNNNKLYKNNNFSIKKDADYYGVELKK